MSLTVNPRPCAPRAFQQIVPAILIMVLLALPVAGRLAPITVSAQSATPTAGAMGGEFMILQPMDERGRTRGRKGVFRLAPGEPLRARFGFVSQYSEPITFRVILLLNYREVDFTARRATNPIADRVFPTGSPVAVATTGELQSALEFEAPPGEELGFELSTGPLDRGFYDLALVVIPEPHRAQRELPYLTVRQHVIRGTVEVGDAIPPSAEFPLLDSNAVEESGYGSVLWFGREPHVAGLTSEVTVLPGASFEAPVNYKAPDGVLAKDAGPTALLPVAFVAVLDGRVTSLNGESVLYGSVMPGRLNWIPINMRAPDEPGIHQVFILAFPNPYVPSRDAAKLGRGTDVLSSQRLIIDVLC